MADFYWFQAGNSAFSTASTSVWSSVPVIDCTATRSTTLVTLSFGSTSGMVVGQTVKYGSATNVTTSLGTVTSIVSASQFRTSTTGTLAAFRFIVGTPLAGNPTSTDDAYFISTTNNNLTITFSGTGHVWRNTYITSDLAGNFPSNTSSMIVGNSAGTVNLWGNVTVLARGFFNPGVAVINGDCTWNLSLRPVGGNSIPLKIMVGAVGASGAVLRTAGTYTSNILCTTLEHNSGEIYLDRTTNVQFYTSFGTGYRKFFTGGFNLQCINTAASTSVNITNGNLYEWDGDGWLDMTPNVNKTSSIPWFSISPTAVTPPTRAPNVKVSANTQISQQLFASGSWVTHLQLTGGIAWVASNINCQSLTCTQNIQGAINVYFAYGGGTWTTGGFRIGPNTTAIVYFGRASFSTTPTHTGTTTINGTYTFAGSTGTTWELTSGYIDLNGFTPSIKQFTSSNSNERGINFNGGTINLSPSSGFGLQIQIANNFTFINKLPFTKNNNISCSFNFGSTSGATTPDQCPSVTVSGTSTSGGIGFTGYFDVLDIVGEWTTSMNASLVFCRSLYWGANNFFNSMVVQMWGADGTLSLTDPSTSRLIGTLNINTTGTLNVICSNTTTGLSVNVLNHINGDVNWNGGRLNMQGSGSPASAGVVGNGRWSNLPIWQMRTGVLVQNGGTFILEGACVFTPHPSLPTATMTFTMSNAGGFGYTNLTFTTDLYSGTLSPTIDLLTKILINSGTLTIDAPSIQIPTGDLEFVEGTIASTVYDLTVGSYTSYGTNARTIDTNSGVLIVNNGFSQTDSTNFTHTSGTIQMASASAKSFASAGGGTYKVLSNTGGGALQITGSNTFYEISGTSQTFIFTAGTTTTLTALAISGTVGAVSTMQSSSAGTQYTLTKPSGTVTLNYMSITDSNATGGATWTALNSTFVSNVTGWLSDASAYVKSKFMAFF